MVGAIRSDITGHVIWFGPLHHGSNRRPRTEDEAPVAPCKYRAFGVSEQLRPGDELTDLFETFVQMTHSLRALERTRLATLLSTLKDAEESGASAVVLEGLHALHVELEPGLGMEKLMRRSQPGSER